MPSRSFKICKERECKELTRDASGYCPAHIHLEEELKKQRCRKYDAVRGSANERGYDSRWVKIRKMFLMRNPLCSDCLKGTRLTPANEVHHVKALKKGGTHDSNNLMSLCKSCHSKRTAKGE